jgi:hypothetical protein
MQKLSPVRMYLGVGAMLSALVLVALAVDPTPEAIASSGGTATVSSLLGVLNANWPILVPVFAALIGIGLVMRLTKRATH